MFDNMDDENLQQDSVEETTVHAEDNDETAEVTETAADYEVQESETVSEIEPEKQKINWKKELWEWTYTLGIALIAVFLINYFVLTMVVVSGQSMEYTLHDGERLVVLHQNIAPVTNGDIVVFRPVHDPERPYIKRVIAVAGQTIDVVDNKVTVDGTFIDEPYIHDRTLKKSTKLPLKVDEGHIFVMGDNRENSADSRYSNVGQVGLDTVIGKAVFRWWPFDKIGTP